AHAGSYRARHRWDRLDALASRARVRHARLARGPARDLSAPGFYARELVLGGGSVCRRHRRLSPGTCARAEASSCRWPARRSGTAAARGERNAARQRNSLTRRPRAIGAGCMARGPAAEGDIMSVKSLEQEAEYVARLEFACRQQALV